MHFRILKTILFSALIAFLFSFSQWAGPESNRFQRKQQHRCTDEKVSQVLAVLSLEWKK